MSIAIADMRSLLLLLACLAVAEVAPSSISRSQRSTFPPHTKPEELLVQIWNPFMSFPDEYARWEWGASPVDLKEARDALLHAHPDLTVHGRSDSSSLQNGQLFTPTQRKGGLYTS